MLTVRLLTSSGEEFIHPTSHVNFVPSKIASSDRPHIPDDGVLWVYDSTGRAKSLSNGIAYVMNDQGSTVAKYDMCPDVGPTTG